MIGAEGARGGMAGAPRSGAARQFQNTTNTKGAERATCIHCWPGVKVVDESIDDHRVATMCRAKRLYLPPGLVNALTPLH